NDRAPFGSVEPLDRHFDPGLNTLVRGGEFELTPELGSLQHRAHCLHVMHGDPVALSGAACTRLEETRACCHAIESLAGIGIDGATPGFVGFEDYAGSVEYRELVVDRCED